MNAGEIADRYTILCIKLEHGINCGVELRKAQEKVKGVDKGLVKKLLKINTRMWELEEEITRTKDLAEVGAIYMRLRDLTMQRAKLKGEPKKY